MWKYNNVEIKVVEMAEQCIYVKVYGINQQLQYSATSIYAFNQLEKRKKLWKDNERLGRNMKHPWISMGDYNNVPTSQDRMGGNVIHEVKYMDLTYMMQSVGLFEASTKGNHFAWSNKHTTDMIYFRIDHMIGNVKWF